MRNHYEIHSSQENQTRFDIIKFVIRSFIPIRFLNIFVSALLRIQNQIKSFSFYENDSRSSDYRYSEVQTKQELKIARDASFSIINFISEYLTIFPKKRFQIVKNFYEVEAKEQMTARNSLISFILKISYRFGKIDRMQKYMSTAAANKGSFSKEGEEIKFSCFAMDVR